MDFIDDLWKYNLSCSGKIAKKWIFRRIKGDKLRFSYYIPYNPKQPNQQFRRSLFHCAVSEWQNKTSSEKDVWDEKIRQRWRCMSGYNLFISDYISKGVEMAVKQIISGSKLCSDGDNDDSISEVDISRSVILFFTGQQLLEFDSTWQWFGCSKIVFFNSSTIRITCNIPSGKPDLLVSYIVVEYI